MSFKPQHLVRLFPGIWRLRYGQEFVAMLESSEPTRRDVADIVRRAAVEWVARTMTGRLVRDVLIVSVAALVAAILRATVPVAPVGLEMLFGSVILGNSIRFLFLVLTRRRPGAREQAVWIAALFVTSILGQWGSMSWTMAVVSLTVMSMDLLMWSNALPVSSPPLVLRRRPPIRPLGLR